MTEEALRVGVIGLGMMGGGIARSLLAAGLRVAVHDLAPALVTGLVDAGARSCDSAAAVAEAVDVVVVVVFDATQVEDVVLGPHGLAGAGRRGLTILVCSTIDPADLQRIATRAQGAGLRVLDAGIAGGPDAAARGGLVTLVGGEAAAVARARPVLDAMSVEVFHAGPLGAGMKLKLVKNTMSYLTMCAVHEALLLGEELGFDAHLLQRVAEQSNLVDQFFWFPMSRSSAHPLDGQAEPAARDAVRFFAEIARKDLAAALAIGEEAGVDLPVTELARRSADRYFLVPAADET